MLSHWEPFMRIIVCHVLWVNKKKTLLRSVTNKKSGTFKHFWLINDDGSSISFNHSDSTCQLTQSPWVILFYWAQKLRKTVINSRFKARTSGRGRERTLLKLIRMAYIILVHSMYPSHLKQISWSAKVKTFNCAIQLKSIIIFIFCVGFVNLKVNKCSHMFSASDILNKPHPAYYKQLLCNCEMRF